MKTVSIYVAAHKKDSFAVPEGYRICQVNAEKNGRWEGNYEYDNAGEDNISIKNESYSELTALYELWKNNDSDIKGLAHYRRYFSQNNSLNMSNFLITSINKSKIKTLALKSEKIEEYLNSCDMILAYPRGPRITNAYENLVRWVYPQDIRILRKTIHQFYPEYEESLTAILNTTRISYLNMYIARKEISDKYCEWLFSVLEKVEKQIDIEDYDTQHKRIFGYFGEILLNVWVKKNAPSVKYAFVLFVKETEGKYSFLKKNQYSRYLKNFYVRLIKKPFYIKQKKLMGILEKLLADPYSHTLDEIYQNIRCAEDVLQYYSENAGTVALDKKKFCAAGREYIYACVVLKNDLSYLKRNSRCLITAFIDDYEVIQDFLNYVSSSYSENHTVNLRFFTSNPEVTSFLRSYPEIYVYQITHDL